MPEVPKFIRNKSLKFSSAILAVGIAACSTRDKDKTLDPHRFPEPTAISGEVLTTTVVIGPLKDQSPQQEEQLDHSCGIIFTEGDPKRFRIPTKTRPYDIDFDVEVKRDQNGNLTFGNMPLSGATYLYVTSQSSDAFRLGYAIPYKENGTVFFAPFQEAAQFLVDGCQPAN